MVNGIDITGNVYVAVAGNYSSGGNLDRFINIGGLYNIDRFRSIGIFGYNSGRGG